MKNLSQLPLFVFFFLGLHFFLIFPSSHADITNKADLILIEKSHYRLTLYNGEVPIKSYAVSLGRGGLKQKTCEGDNLTPEGEYVISNKNDQSQFHRALKISYPNANDLKRAQAKGCSPGGDIMIHGMKNGLGWIGFFHQFFDWTRGCIAVTDKEIDEIWRMVDIGTQVEIRP